MNQIHHLTILFLATDLDQVQKYADQNALRNASTEELLQLCPKMKTQQLNRPVLESLAWSSLQNLKSSCKYNLVANICHENTQGGTELKSSKLKSSHTLKGLFKCQVLNKTSKQWYEIQDLHVQSTLPQLVALSESYIQIWERKSH